MSDKPHEDKTAIEREINSLHKNAAQLVDKTIESLHAYHPESIEEMMKNITEEEKNGNTAIMLGTEIGLKLTFGVRKTRMDDKPVVLASIGINGDDGKALNILDGVEDELLEMIPEAHREDVELQMDTAKYDGVEQIILEVIYPGTAFADLKKKPIAIKITVAPSGMTDRTFGFGMVKDLKKVEEPVLKVSRNCMKTMGEMLGIIAKLQPGQLMKNAFKCKEEIRSALDCERSEAAN